MPKLLKFFSCAIIVSLLITGCASGYHAINPPALNFTSTSGDSVIAVEYQTNLLTGKYLKREISSDVYLVAVKITNNSTHDISFTNNLKIFSGEEEVMPIPLNRFYDATQQNPDKSLNFLFLAPLNVYSFSETTQGNQVTSQKNRFYPVGIIVAPALALGNMAGAKGANKKFKKELEENDISDRIIPAGHSEYGLIAVKDVSSSNLTFKRTF